MSAQDCEQLTLFQEDSPASRSVLPGSAEAVRMTVTSGQRCLELYRKSGPLGSLVRMLLESSHWRSTKRYLTWKVSVTPAKRLLFQLVPSVPRTDETDVQFWPTPKATDYKGSGPAGSKGAEHDLKHRNLKGFVMYATPQARDYRTGQTARWDSPERSRNLNDQIGGQLNPTWVEWLMGFPTGWTDLDALETP